MSLLTLLKPAPPPIDANPAVAVPTTAQIAAALFAAPGALAANFVTQVTSPSQDVTGATFVLIDRVVTAAEVASAADFTLLNAIAGKVIFPLAAYVQIITTAVAPSSGRTVSLAWTAGGNALTGSITTAVGNLNNLRSFDFAEAAIGTRAQGISQNLVCRSTSAAVTGNGATARLWVIAMIVTPT